VVVFNNVDYGDLPMLTDNDSGEIVSIPSVMIQNDDGVTLMTFVTNGALEVEIEIAWGLPRLDGRVEWELWTKSEMSSTEILFVSKFRDVVQSLGDSLLFTPHYGIQRGMREAAKKDCSNNGKYCMISVNGVPGVELLRESLTQICVREAGVVVSDTLL